MLIEKNLIVLDMEAATKEEVIRQLGQKAVEAGRVNDLDGYVNAVLAREAEYSTGVGFGLAIPHGKTDAVSEPLLMFAKVKPMNWESLDGTDVTMVFMIGVPESEAGSMHLKILAGLSRKLMKKDFREALATVDSEDGLIDLLKDSDIGI